MKFVLEQFAFFGFICISDQMLLVMQLYIMHCVFHVSANANTFNDWVTHSIHVSANANTFNDWVTHSIHVSANANTFNDWVTHSIHVSANANTFNDWVTHSIHVSANANTFNDWVTHSNTMQTLTKPKIMDCINRISCYKSVNSTCLLYVCYFILHLLLLLVNK